MAAVTASQPGKLPQGEASPGGGADCKPPCQMGPSANPAGPADLAAHPEQWPGRPGRHVSRRMDTCSHWLALSCHERYHCPGAGPELSGCYDAVSDTKGQWRRRLCTDG
ncbi:hypothetical protein TREES_T100008360 [Tupaia chinensis]|uniref:Uncharacterized protein n=1 Tax=Tupaia chinensis TaxID=246437 RepID=L9LAX7_TUPCH|nr:hypothetical protein TREES_T100008360 [Tupaia chinensis]